MSDDGSRLKFRDAYRMHREVGCGIFYSSIVALSIYDEEPDEEVQSKVDKKMERFESSIDKLNDRICRLNWRLWKHSKMNLGIEETAEEKDTEQ